MTTHGHGLVVLLLSLCLYLPAQASLQHAAVSGMAVNPTNALVFTKKSMDGDQ
jgi:hypothetical protein